VGRVLFIGAAGILVLSLALGGCVAAVTDSLGGIGGGHRTAGPRRPGRHRRENRPSPRSGRDGTTPRRRPARASRGVCWQPSVGSRATAAAQALRASPPGQPGGSTGADAVRAGTFAAYATVGPGGADPASPTTRWTPSSARPRCCAPTAGAARRDWDRRCGPTTIRRSTSIRSWCWPKRYWPTLGWDPPPPRPWPSPRPPSVFRTCGGVPGSVVTTVRARPGGLPLGRGHPSPGGPGPVQRWPGGGARDGDSWRPHILR